jgi:hypothetical protein
MISSAVGPMTISHSRSFTLSKRSFMGARPLCRGDGFR